MATTKKPRMTLAERRRQAADEIAQPTPAAEPDEAPTQTGETAPEETGRREPARQQSRKRKTTAQVAREKGKVPLGLYFANPDDLELARRAFVTDFWEHDGPDTFSEWISQAILAHEARGHARRTQLAQPRTGRRSAGTTWLRCSDCNGVCRWSGTSWVCNDCGHDWSEADDPRYAAPAETAPKGKLRKIDVRREVSEAVEKGIAEDRHQLRRQITISAWCNDAVMTAIATTRKRTAGELMHIDGPLPPKLRK